MIISDYVTSENILIESSLQPSVRLNGFFCPSCNFKSTHKSYYDEHIKCNHKSVDESKNEDENKNDTRTTVFKFPSQKVVTLLPVTHNNPDGQKLKFVQKPRYFCCYCGLEQFETERLLRHISVVHLKW